VRANSFASGLVVDLIVANGDDAASKNSGK
jgi:hypothetical protein